MYQLKEIAQLFFFTAIILAISSGCTTGPEKKPTSKTNQESESKEFKETEYY
jgi:hypothetical protein